MNQAYLHLMINHLPVMGTVFGVLILFSGWTFKNSIIKRTALGLFIFSCVAIIPAHISGEGAEELIERLPEINHDTIHAHADLSSKFGWTLLIVALLSAFNLYFDIKNKPGSKYIYIVILMVALLSLFFAHQTAHSGGLIRHPEIGNS